MICVGVISQLFNVLIILRAKGKGPDVIFACLTSDILDIFLKGP